MLARSVEVEMARMMLRGWNVPAGEETAHWFKKGSIGYRSLCGSVLLLVLYEQESYSERVRKCRACDLELEKRAARGLPTE